MRLLSEIIDRVEVDRVKLLLESNGIPVYRWKRRCCP